MVPVPWLLVGDFNSILSTNVHSDQVSLSAADNEFASYVDSLDISDCSYSGPIFTWSNK